MQIKEDDLVIEVYYDAVSDAVMIENNYSDAISLPPAVLEVVAAQLLELLPTIADRRRRLEAYYEAAADLRREYSDVLTG